MRRVDQKDSEKDSEEGMDSEEGKPVDHSEKDSEEGRPE